MDYEAKAKVFKAFCDPGRLHILHILQNGEKCACKLLEELNMSQSTLSHHMRILEDSGVVKGRRSGKWVHYSLDPVGIDNARMLLEECTRVCLCADAEEDCECVA